MDCKVIKKLYLIILFFYSIPLYAIEFQGKFLQGHYIIGITDPSANIIIDKNSITVNQNKEHIGAKIQTAPYPGFPTDLQAQMMVLLCKANKKSSIKEDIFENRFQSVSELRRMNAAIEVKGNKAIINNNAVNLEAISISIIFS